MTEGCRLRQGLRVLVAAVLVAALTGCSAVGKLFGRDKAPSEPPEAKPTASAPSPPAPATPARDLFPAADWQFAYAFDDGTRSDEFMLPDGDRYVQTYNGTAYIAWFHTPQGVLRADPRGTGAPLLLRYLPPALADGQVWRQPVKGDSVWFKLDRLPACAVTGATPKECWQLQVLNRGDLTSFTFATGLGAVSATSDNATAPRESFRKVLMSHGPVQVPEKDRMRFLGQVIELKDGTPGAVEPATAEEFAAALARHRQQGAAAGAEPVDYVEGARTAAPLPRYPGACPGGSGSEARLQVQVRDAEWRAHPLSPAQLRTPSLTLTICNAGAAMTQEQQLQLSVSGETGLRGGTLVRVPPLAAGEALGPVRVYSEAGVPASVLAVWQRDGTRWPAVTARVLQGDRTLAQAAVRRYLAPDGKGEMPGGNPGFPDPPPLAALIDLAWGEAGFSPDGQRKLRVFLYAPDALYAVQTAPYCGALAGAIGAAGQKWALYMSADDSAPVRVLDLGALDFPGGRGLTASPQPGAGITFLFLGQYGSCANPNRYLIYAYDHATGEVFRTVMKDRDGQTRPATASNNKPGADGFLTDEVHENTGSQQGLHRYVWNWSRGERAWLLEQHVPPGKQ